MIRLGRANLPIRSATVSRISVDELVGALEVVPSSVTNAQIAWPVSSSAWPITAASATLPVGDDRRLDLGRRQPVPGHVDDVVDPPDDPEVAVLVLARGVADQVGLLAELREVRLDEPVVLLVERAEHRRPRALEHQQSLPVVDRLALALVDHVGRDARGTGASPSPAWSATIPGSGVIMIAPVSVCHQVSTIGQRSPPTTL